MKEYVVKSVIFDMDGVITNTMPDHCRAWKSILKSKGINVNDSEIYEREGQQGMQSVREIYAKYQKKFTLSIAKEVLLEKENLFKDIVETKFIVGARRFLKTLFYSEFKLALVTGTSRHELQKMLPKEMLQRFSATVTGCEVKNGKPHPEPYLKSLRLLGIKPNEAVVIENAPFGIQSAKAAGINCIALETSLSQKYLKQADFIFSSIKEMQRQIKFTNLN